mmetsp:Transcript_97975/g.299469  ORF Transcript_97975/g.299469 Transcript_97975/m.299469 type:complete len:309 (-) Transcript_97975:566-1492(-)
MLRHRPVARLGHQGFAVRAHERGHHQAGAPEALRDQVRQHVAVVVLARPDEAPVAFDHLRDHFVDQQVLEPNPPLLERLFVVGLVHVLEGVDKETVVGLQRAPLGRQIQRQLLVQRMLEATLRKVLDRLARIVHAHHDAAARRELVDHGLLGFNASTSGTITIGLEDEPEGACGARHELARLADVALGVAAQDDRLLPARDVPWDVGDRDRRGEHRPVELGAQQRPAARPHLLQIELQHARLVRGDGGALDAHVVQPDRLGSVERDVVLRLIPVRDAQIVIIQLHVEERENQFLFDHLPYDSRHLVAI